MVQAGLSFLHSCVKRARGKNSIESVDRFIQCYHQSIKKGADAESLSNPSRLCLMALLSLQKRALALIRALPVANVSGKSPNSEKSSFNTDSASPIMTSPAAHLRKELEQPPDLLWHDANKLSNDCLDELKDLSLSSEAGLVAKEKLLHLLGGLVLDRDHVEHAIAVADVCCDYIYTIWEDWR
jgi:hypothetical protein